MSSLLSQVCDPSFTFNCIYHNVARMINRVIIKSENKTITMAAKIKRKHFHMLEKLSELFFQTQTLQASRYMLLPQTKLKDLKNYIMAFSDGSLHFSTSCIYFVSCDRNSDRTHCTLINTMSKLAEDTKINKTEESIPAKEMHGLWLAVSNMLRLITRN